MCAGLCADGAEAGYPCLTTPERIKGAVLEAARSSSSATTSTEAHVDGCFVDAVTVCRLLWDFPELFGPAATHRPGIEIGMPSGEGTSASGV